MLAPPLGIGPLTHAFWAEVRQRVNKAQRVFRQEFKRIGIKERIACVSVSYCCGVALDTVRFCHSSII